MQNEENIVSYTMDELKAKLARGEDRTNWDRLRAMTDEELEASIDWDEEGEWDLDSARGDIPGPQAHVSLTIDDDIIAWFRAEVAGTGLGFKTRMNDALREHMETRRAQPAPADSSTVRRSG